MESSNLLRHELIRNYIAQCTEHDANGLVSLWQSMAVEIVALVGERGFISLYERCIGLTKTSFPWLAIDPTLPPGAHRFAELQLHIEEQSIAQTVAANNQLLITFTDLLASLIGEQIVAVILNTAMGNRKNCSANNKEIENG